MDIPAVVANLLKTVAPTLLSSLALPPPLNLVAANIASNALSGFLGQTDNTANAGGTSQRATPDQVVKAIEAHSSDPELVLALRRAEDDLKKYEMDTSIRFAELDNQDRTRAGNFQISANLGDKVFAAGVNLVWTAMISMGLMILFLILAVAYGTELPDNNLAIAAFGLVGTAVGFINGLAGAVVSFYWGSSQSSQDKSDTIASTMKDMGGELAKAAARNPAPPPGPPTPPAEQPAAKMNDNAPESDPVAAPATSAARSLLGEILPGLVKPHHFIAEGVEWNLTVEGVAIDGTPARGSAGEPTTVQEIWRRYGDLCASAAKRYGVPVELIVATIATESSGRPDARRSEPQIGDESVGLMQTLVRTARNAVGKPNLTANDLLDPETSILAGTAYIAQQRGNTHFDPPLVAAAYNAGSLRREDSGANRWKLKCFPLGSGLHIDKYVGWFCDAMHVSGQGNWSKEGDVPSFAFELSRSGSAAKQGGASTDTSTDTFVFDGNPIELSMIGGREDLVRPLQQRLSQLGYLDPPPDGKFGLVSNWAFDCFCAENGVADASTFNIDIVRLLRQPTLILPALRTGDWFDNVIKYMEDKNYWICREPECINIVYVEGVNANGTCNANRPNCFNDLRIVFWVDKDKTVKFRSWEATSQPGSFWIQHPLNPQGAARIAFGQYKSWIVGTHHLGKPSAHEALVQTEPVTVHRILNRDFERVGDPTESGVFGINQHWGYDAPEDDIGRASAGCLVGRTIDGHKEFMEVVKSDPRYKASGGYRFVTTILPGNQVQGLTSAAS